MYLRHVEFPFLIINWDLKKIQTCDNKATPLIANLWWLKKRHPNTY